MDIEAFLTEEEEQAIVNAIQEAEQNTSGEIRVHIEATANGDIEKRTIDVFHDLGMDNTKLHNGVLIYIAVNDQNFTIYGDMGINKVVPDNFWNSSLAVIQEHFMAGEFKKGLVEGILLAGQQLKHHFPKGKDDVNELPNTISKA